MSLFRFKLASDRPRWPRCPQDGPKMAPRSPQDGPRRPQDGPKTPPRRLQDASSTLLLLASLSLDEESSRASPQEASKRPQETPRGPPKAPKRLPRGPQEAPKKPQEAPKRPPRRPQDAPKAILRRKLEISKNLQKLMLFVTFRFFRRMASHWACNMSPLGCRRGPALRAESGGRPLGCPQCQIPLGLILTICLPQGKDGLAHSADPVTANWHPAS